jgi:hypothetical protein
VAQQNIEADNLKREKLERQRREAQSVTEWCDRCGFTLMSTVITEKKAANGSWSAKAECCNQEGYPSLYILKNHSSHRPLLTT